MADNEKTIPYSFGWIRQHPDPRDFKLTSVALKELPDLPKEVDLRNEDMPAVYDQGNIGSCGPNAAAGAAEFLVNRDNYKWPFTPSRLFIYYNTRKTMGYHYIPFDSGVTLRALFKAFNKYGVCPEAEPTHPDKKDPGWWWTYSDDKEKFKRKPPEPCFKNAKYHKALRYEAVPLDESAIKSALAEKVPVVFGIIVYESFVSKETAKTGIIPMPGKDEDILGGHAMTFVGYKEIEGKNYFIFRNSWGEDWGDKGYGYLPVEYATNPDLGSDYWALFSTGYAE